MDAAVQGIAASAAVLAVAGLVDKQVAPVRPCGMSLTPACSRGTARSLPNQYSDLNDFPDDSLATVGYDSDATKDFSSQA